MTHEMNTIYNTCKEIEIKVIITSFTPSYPDTREEQGSGPEIEYELYLVLNTEKWNKETNKFEKVKIEIPAPDALYEDEELYEEIEWYAESLYYEGQQGFDDFESE